jgi:uncharacterized protein YecT (DUF1311 family)
MLNCIAAETSRQDAQLNENYKKLMSNVSEHRKKLLLEAQGAWIRFRDANCSFYADGPRLDRAGVSQRVHPGHVGRSRKRAEKADGIIRSQRAAGSG